MSHNTKLNLPGWIWMAESLYRWRAPIPYKYKMCYIHSLTLQDFAVKVHKIYFLFFLWDVCSKCKLISVYSTEQSGSRLKCNTCKKWLTCHGSCVLQKYCFVVMDHMWHFHTYKFIHKKQVYQIHLVHPGLSKIPAPIGGPGSDILKLGITIGQKLGAGRFLIIMGKNVVRDYWGGARF